MKGTIEIEPWRVTTRQNRSGNLTIEVELDGEIHAEVVLQQSGKIDLGTKARPWQLGPKGWAMPGAVSTEFRKFRFAPED